MLDDILKLAKVFANSDSIMSSLKERTVGRDKVEGRNLTVSTVLTPDMGYETAIIDDDEIYPVERYKTKEGAEKGHKKWLNKLVITKDRNGYIPSKYFDIRVLAYGNISASYKVRLKN